MAPPRILYLSPCSPFGRVHGTKLRTRQIARALQALGSVDFIVVKPPDADSGPAEEPSLEPFSIKRYITARRLTSRSIINRARCGLDPKYLDYYGWYVEEADRRAALEETRQYDLTWICNLRTANLLGQWQWPRSVLDIDDIPSAVLRSERESKGSLLLRARAAIRVPIARLRERRLSARFTTLCVSSEPDRQYLRTEEYVHVIPNGFPTPETEPSRSPAVPLRIGFIGIFDYAPNRDGVRWFINECWPTIRREFGDARLRLVGKGSDAPWIPRDNGIDGLGWVDDSAGEIATWSAMIVPLHTGGGTRIKIAEGFSRKCPVVSTSFGAHGYDVQNGVELLLGDSASDFANACATTLRRPADATLMADRAWRRFLDTWTWDAIGPRVREAAETCLARESTRAIGTRPGIPRRVEVMRRG